MKSSKMGTEFKGMLQILIIGIIGMIAWAYSNNKGVTGQGMKIVQSLSMLFIFISIISIILTRYLEKNPIKSIGFVNKDDEMLKLIRYKAAYASFEITSAVVILVTILTATEIIKIDISMYALGIVIFVGMNFLSLICTFIYSNRTM
jgi:hypothetical protein